MIPHDQREQEVAIRAVREAAGLCRTVRRQIAPDVLDKADLSPVTVADFGSQALICRALAEAFPADPVIAEEDAADLPRPGREGLLVEVLKHVRVAHPGAGPDDVCRWIDHGGTRAYSGRF